MEHGRIGRLTSGQIECLLLVNKHLTSKEIAVRLGISPHTVDQRIRQALQVLNVERRAQAARLVLDGKLGYSQIASRDREIHAGLREDERLRQADGGWLPFATSKHPTNKLSSGRKLLWICAMACGIMASSFMLLAGLESLARMISK